MKKILSGLVCGIYVLSSIAYAQINKPVINSETGIYTVSGTSDIHNGYVSLVVTLPDKNISDITVDNISEIAVNVCEVQTDENGEWSGRFVLPSDAVCGRYTVYAGAGDVSDFYYANAEEIGTALEALQNASLDELCNTIYEYTVEKEILGLNLIGDYEIYTSDDAGRMLFSKAMGDFLKQYPSLAVKDATLAFEKALEVMRFVKGDADTVAQCLSNGLLAVEFEKEHQDSIAEMYCGLRTESTELAHIQKEIRISEALVMINSATKGKMTEILKNYNDVLSLDLGGEYSSLDKVEVNKGLISQNFSDLESLKKAFESSVAYVAEEADSNNRQPSGGGGGSGGRVTSNVSYAPPVQDVNSSTDKSKPKRDETKNSFSDIDAAPWAEQYITALSEKGVINGVGDGKFDPLGTVTREAFLKMLISGFDIKGGGVEAVFEDVDNKEWYAPYINSAVSIGITNGISDSVFGIGEPVTREQMAVMAVRMLEYLGLEVSQKELSFTDSDKISEYAKPLVSVAYGTGIISGMPDGSFAPQSHLNRAQAAKVIYEIMKVGGADV